MKMNLVTLPLLILKLFMTISSGVVTNPLARARQPSHDPERAAKRNPVAQETAAQVNHDLFKSNSGTDF
jgi:hypothetical protein